MASSRSSRRNPEVNLHPCIWMQAGVVEHKPCRKNYFCTACRFDRVMRDAAEANRRGTALAATGKRSRIVHWKDKLRELPAASRPCIHSLKGSIAFRSCAHDYHCGRCTFDQYFSNEFLVHASVEEVRALDIEGFAVPQGYYYHRGHTWVRIEEGASVRIGLDEFALRLLGPLDRIETPLMGKTLMRDEAGIALIRAGMTCRAASPVSGVVTAVNAQLRENTTLAAQSPYEDGWFLQVHATDLRGDLRHLMLGPETRSFLTEEIDRVQRLVEEVAGPLAADGGRLVDDLFGHLPQIGWNRLGGLVLHTAPGS